MINSRMFFIRLLVFCFAATSFIQCSKENIEPVPPQDDIVNNDDDPNDDGTEKETGTIGLKMTDAPIDNATVKAVFVTVTEIKVDGKVYEGFEGKQTIDVLALQNGRVEGLGMTELETGAYSSISLVLDHETDANGDAPGCYLITTNGIKQALSAGAAATQEIRIQNDFEVEEDQHTDFVIDFDLRKAIMATSESNNEMEYGFVTDAELQAALRIVSEADAGKVVGTCKENPLIQSDKIIVYAYQKGSFDWETEVTGQGESKIEFAKAVTSASVKSSGEFHLAFLEEGDYELVFVSYKKDNHGKVEVEGKLEVVADLGLDIGNVGIDARSQTNVNVLVTGIIPL